MRGVFRSQGTNRRTDARQLHVLAICYTQSAAKHCRRGSLHPCECWLLLVVINTLYTNFFISRVYIVCDVIYGLRCSRLLQVLNHTDSSGTYSPSRCCITMHSCGRTRRLRHSSLPLYVGSVRRNEVAVKRRAIPQSLASPLRLLRVN